MGVVLSLRIPVLLWCKLLLCCPWTAINQAPTAQPARTRYSPNKQLDSALCFHHERSVGCHQSAASSWLAPRTIEVAKSIGSRCVEKKNEVGPFVHMMPHHDVVRCALYCCPSVSHWTFRLIARTPSCWSHTGVVLSVPSGQGLFRVHNSICLVQEKSTASVDEHSSACVNVLWHPGPGHPGPYSPSCGQHNGQGKWTTAH